MDRLRAALQGRLRRMLLRLLEEGLDLSDPGTLQLLRAPLQKLRSLLHGQCLSGVAHADQWMALARVAGVPHGDRDSTPQLASSRSTDSPKGQIHKRNLNIKKLALTAMANLGGQATSKELRKEIARMPESSTLTSETAPDRPGVKVVKVWERTVCTNMGMWFERAETRRVYRLRGSGGSTSPVSWSIGKKLNIGLKKLALTAMAKLGGQATAKQIRAEMEKENPALRTALRDQMSKRKWRPSMNQWFEPVETLSKQGAVKIWRLRGSART